MKKLIMTIGAILFLATTVDSFINAIQRRRRPGSIGRGRYSSPQRRSLLRSRALAQARTLQKKTSTQSSTTTQATKTPPTTKPAEQVAAAEKKVEEKTKDLETAVNNIESAQTPAQKEAAIKTAQQRAQELIASMKAIDRTYTGDLLGYDEKKIQLAQSQIEQLKQEQDVVKKEIEAKEKELAELTEPGSVWTLWQASPKAGKEADYNRLRVEISNLNSVWGGLEKEIQTRKVVTTEAWSNAYKALMGAGVALVAAGAADVALTHGENIGTIASAVRDVGGRALGSTVGAAGIGIGYASLAVQGALKISEHLGNYKFGFFLLTSGYSILQYLKQQYNDYTKDPNAKPEAKAKTEQDIKEIERFIDITKQYQALKKDPQANKAMLAQLATEINMLYAKHESHFKQVAAQQIASQQVKVQK